MTGKQVAVVTGAARGSGAAVVRRLAKDGWAVVTVDRCADDPDMPHPLARAGQLADRQLTCRLLEPEEVARACTPEAGAVTGSVLHVGGGFAG
jgi:NAD(P)-dependent dehydrogenase (short-subunit alcohol dehydrogenase family)